MGPNHCPTTANSRRSGVQVQTCTYLNSTYSYIPATPIPRDRLRSRPSRRNCPVAQGIHLARPSLKPPSTGLAQPHHDTHNDAHHRPRYPYPPASQTQGHPTKQSKNDQTFASTQAQRKHEATGQERRASSNYVLPPSISPPASPAVAMAFVPEQPARRAMAFEPSLFQRNDSSVTPPRSYQRMPLSELIIPPNISSNRYTHVPPRSPLHGPLPCREKPPRKTVPRPPRRSCVQPPPSPLSPLPSPPLRRENSSQQNSSRFIRPFPREEDEILSTTPLKLARPPRAAPLTRPARK